MGPWQREGVSNLAGIRKQLVKGADVITLDRGPIQDHFVTLVPEGDESPASLFRRAGEVVHEVGGEVISVEVLGMATSDRKDIPCLMEAVDGSGLAVGWVENTRADNLCGVHIWLLSGVPVQRIACGDGIIGSLFEDDCGRCCRLVGLLPSELTVGREDQSRAIFAQMESALQGVGMTFSDVFRTWFYNHDILDWYGEFNAVRTDFFRERDIFAGVVPASTGIGGCNAADAALVAGLVALQPRDPEVKVLQVSSPLQSSARDYGSSFSRAVEVTCPDHRRLYVSGTASIDRAGATVHVGDCKAQVKLTMEVVGEILKSRQMDWGDVTRALAYFKRAEDASLLAAYRQENDLPRFPVIVAENDVCRDELLFELEIDAVQVR
jgi:enamine deaminase RidA (YjgF/YER057c/UK114 family)